MKRFIVCVFVSVVLLTSCEMPIGLNQVEHYTGLPYDIREPTIELDSLADIAAFIDTLTYKSDKANYGTEEHWAAPQELIDRGCGDCEDFAILVMYFADKIGYSTELVGISTANGFHALVRLNGKLYEPQNMSRKYGTYDEVCHYSLDDCLSICYNAYDSRNVVDNAIFD